MKPESEIGTVSRLEPIPLDGAHEPLECVILTLPSRQVQVELCTLGASITKYLVGSDKSTPADEWEDIVLGYKDAKTMYEAGNPVFFGAVVGRVANRIQKGTFQLNDTTYSLEINNEPNHLHGGSGGFSHRLWKIKRTGIIDSDSQQIPYCTFEILSADGDQGYPGNVKVTATYSLRPSMSSTGSTLRLEFSAELQDGETLSTPINLAQHSYFNLSPSKLESTGILDHTLSLECDEFTPLDESQIPTRKVEWIAEAPAMVPLASDPTLREAIDTFGEQSESLSQEQRSLDLQSRKPQHSYGIDHNFVVRKDQGGLALPHVATLSSGRRNLKVYSSQPGVQVYTANYLDPETQSDSNCKSAYRPWSGICIETQHFPDSIHAESSKDPRKMPSQYQRGKCPILTPSASKYNEVVEYVLDHRKEDSSGSNVQGSDTEGRKFESLEAMWEGQAMNSWYTRSSDYYETHCDTTVDGVLGGIGWLTDMDLDGSKAFVDSLSFPSDWEKKDMIACECGAGIGRVTKGLLLDVCGTSDLVESSSRLLYSAPDYIGNRSSRCRFFCSELQDWQPTKGKYALVWVQWVAIYLTDADVVVFLKRLGESLRPGGFIVLKENTCVESEAFVVDVDDASMTRSLPYWRDLIFQAGLQVVKETWQDNFPDHIFPVPMLALQPYDFEIELPQRS